MIYFLIFTSIYLVVLGLSFCSGISDLHCDLCDLLLQHVGSNSIMRDLTQAPCLGSMGSSYHWNTREVSNDLKLCGFQVEVDNKIGIKMQKLRWGGGMVNAVTARSVQFSGSVMSNCL